MMRKITRSRSFLKDLELAEKRNFDLSLLESVVVKLAKGETLEPIYRDHKLHGTLEGFRECHIKPDWLLIYCIYDDELELFLFRTGTHSDLF